MKNLKLILPITAVVLLILPTFVKWLDYYQGIELLPSFSGTSYNPTILEFNPNNVQPRPVVYNQDEYQDEPIDGEGKVIIDLTHGNNLTLNDLGPFKNRLQTRGVEVVVRGENGDEPATLRDSLHGATSLVILVPTTPYGAEERETIVDFVNDGGRLLLVADPTRPVPPADEQFLTLFDIFFPQSAVPAINSLANAFNINYVDDYIYSLVEDETENNYRNVRLTNFADNHPLTENLDMVVMFAGFSLYGDGITVLQGTNNTNSPVRTGEPDLAGAVLTHNEQVLALGDVTMLIPPYHTVADNNQFLSNLANWLASDNRERTLEDFPHLFTSSLVHIVQTNQELTDPRLIAKTAELRPVFEKAGLEVTLSAPTNIGNDDVIYVGTFDQTEIIEPYLVTAGITITLQLTPTNKLTDTESDTDDEDSEVSDETELFDEELLLNESDVGLEEIPLITDTIILTTTSTLTDTTDLTDTTTLDESEDDTEITKKDDTEITIEIASMGIIPAQGTTLYIVDHSQDNLVMLVLAEDGVSAMEGIDKLTLADLDNCVENDSITLCSTGESLDGSGLDGLDETLTDETDSSETGDKLGTVFILSDNDGPEGSRTGADDWVTYLGDTYDLTVWSTSDDGIPETDDVTGYDVYIIDSGDYAASIDDFETFFAFIGVESDAGVMFIGSQPLPTPLDDATFEALNDLEVTVADHPISDGFTEGDIILLETSESGVDPVVIPNPEELYEDATIVLSRGPDSPSAGTPVVVAATDSTTDSRIILATFALYRLPETERELFIQNSATWLIGNK